jgi:hypothetical protein
MTIQSYQIRAMTEGKTNLTTSIYDLLVTRYIKGKEIAYCYLYVFIEDLSMVEKIFVNEQLLGFIIIFF